jgi:hypothetical protein
VHEASEEVELVLLLVKILGQKGTLPFKVIILSATLDFKTLSEYFSQLPEVADSSAALQDTKEPESPTKRKDSESISASPEQDGIEECSETDEATEEVKRADPELAQKVDKELDQHLATLQMDRSGATATDDTTAADGKSTIIDVSIHSKCRSALGIHFLHKDWYEDRQGSTVHFTSWQVNRVKPQGAAFNLVQPDDILISVGGQEICDVHDYDGKFGLKVILRKRPLHMQFRRPAAAAPKVASELVSLAAETPYAVDIHYLDDEQVTQNFILGDLPSQFFNTLRFHAGFGPEGFVLELCAELLLAECTPEDSALVFLPGIAEIEHFQKVLIDRIQARADRAIDIVILHSITLSEKCEVVQPSDKTRPTAYIASSIAETSITLPELAIVFDFGLSRGASYDAILEMEQLVTRLASKTSGKQRAGRVGRTKPGRVYRLYPKESWEEMPNHDSWGGGGSRRCLESMILLVIKTLVPHLAMDICKCLQLLVQPPSSEDVDSALSRLQEIDAVIPCPSGNMCLTCFGEFAVCLNVIGPRLARLVFCGLLFDCVRSTMALAALHSVCGKSDLLNVPYEQKKAAKDDDSDADEQLQVVTIPVDIRPLGMGFNLDPLSRRCIISEVNENSVAKERGFKVGDEIFSVNSLSCAECGIDAFNAEIRVRPLRLTTKRKVSSEVTMKSKVYQQNVQLARYNRELDEGWLSEPISGLRLFQRYLSRQVKGDMCSLHKMRQTDGNCREIGAKLKSMRGTTSQRGRQGNFKVLQQLDRDAHFWKLSFDQPLSSQLLARSLTHGFLTDCLETDKRAEFRMVLCAAFPSNFLVGALKPKPTPKEQKETPPTDAAAPSAETETGETDLPQASESSPASTPVPPITLRAVPSAMKAEDIIKWLNAVFKCEVVLTQVEGQPPGNYDVRFASEQFAGIWSRPADGYGQLALLGAASWINMVCQREPRGRLLLPISDNISSSLEASSCALSACGDWHVEPIFEWICCACHSSISNRHLR